MNKKVGEYLLQERLGMGHYGTVYLALHISTNRHYAIKVTSVDRYAQTPRLEEFTTSEIGVLGKLNNQHIIRFVEMLRTSSNYYMVYEYCNGGTLAQLLSKRQYLPESEAIEIFSQLVSAFRALFKENILHRDLKPANILFHDGVVKIADFGFCKELIRPGEMTRTLIGSPMYMAPEVLRGRKYDYRADIWSLGVLLYEMLFGRCPFEECTMSGLLLQIECSELKMPTDKYPVSRSIQSLLRKMLTVDPEKRLNAKELSDCSLVRVQSLNSRDKQVIPEIRISRSPMSPRSPRSQTSQEQEREKKVQEQRDLLHYHRRNLEFMLETFQIFLNALANDKDSLLMSYLLYKLIFCYQTDLMSGSMYWQAVRMRLPLPHSWNQSIPEQAEKLEEIGEAIKACISNLPDKLERRTKIEMNTHYCNVGYYLELAQQHSEDKDLQHRLLRCMLIYRHMFEVMELGKVDIQRYLKRPEQNDEQRTFVQMQAQCREFVREAEELRK